MKKKKLALGIIGLLALTVTSCSIKFVSRSTSFNQDTSSYESHESSVDTNTSSSSDISSISSSVPSSNQSSSVASSSKQTSSSQASSSSATSSSSQASSSVTSSSSKTSSSQSSSSQASSSAASSSSSASSSMSSSSSSASSSSIEPDKHVTLDIFSINDFHGNVIDTSGKGLGLAKATTALNELSADKNSVFISQGDMWQGSVESNYTRGNLVTEWMNSMNFVSMAVGNHEFDWGQQAIANNQNLADFPILGINVLYKSNDTRVNYLQPSTTFERDGAKIGVIGAIGNCISSISSSLVNDVYFAKDDDLSYLVKQESTRLRNEEHCDFIIYSLHGSPSGDTAENYDISLSSGHYVDLVLEGHTHESYAYTDDAGIYHIQGKAYNQEVYQITVDLDLTHKSFDVEEIEPINFSCSNSPYKNYAEDDGVKALLDKYYDQYSIAYEELGVVSEYKNATVLRNKVADLYYEKGNQKWSSYNIVLGGGFISCRASGIGPGTVTYGDVAECFPFDNEIVLCWMEGRQLKYSQFVTGTNSNYFVKWADESFINDIANIDLYETYYLVTDTYTTDYYKSTLHIVDYLQQGKYARDLVADYIREGNWTDTPSVIAHDGTISDPKTIEEAREQAVNYTDGSSSPGYYFKGIVSSLATSLGSSTGDMNRVYVRDQDKDNSMMIYYLKKFYGANQNNGNWTSIYDLSIGDELIFYGKPFLYGGTTLEFASGAYVYSINGIPTEP